MKKIIIFYDENCQLCQFLRNWFMKVKRKNVGVEWRHYEDAPACGLTDYTCGESMKVQTADGELHQAFYAVRALVGYSSLFFLKPLLYFPGVPFLGERAYAYIAKNRHRFGRKSHV